jgi:hypothetical protein
VTITSVGLVPAMTAPPPTGSVIAATGSSAFYSVPVSATGTLPAGVQSQTAGASIATFTGAAVRNIERDFSMAVGGVLGLIALFA